jgi:hypothetical protein
MHKIISYLAIIGLLASLQLAFADRVQAKLKLTHVETNDKQVEVPVIDTVRQNQPQLNVVVADNKRVLLHEQEGLIGQAKLKVKQFSMQLKAELVAAIQSGGLEAGVEVCHTKAPQIAAGLSVDGWTVARTSLKTRNEKNTPDQWEADVLIQFDKRFKQGEKPATLVTTLSEEKRFRLMKAIPMNKVCLACHGRAVDPNLQKTIQEHYPNDTATGFSLEDIRGAFTLQKDLAE